MISANDALKKAALTAKDIMLAKIVMKKINRHIHNKMTFAGIEPLELSPDDLNTSAAKVICIWLKRLGWNASISLGVKQSDLGGRSTIWQLLFLPHDEIYETFVPDFELPAEHLDA